MALIRGQVNPLNILNFRKLKKIPPHFAKIIVKDREREFHDIDRWIYKNLDSRYCIKFSTVLDDNKITNVIEIGVEDPKEMTMLSLACPFLYKK